MSKSSIRISLSSACYCLLGTTATANTKPWFVDLGIMNYIEQDRNTGIELIVNGKRELDDGDAISLQFDFDVITGATPNGASASNVTQSFTMASGSNSYRVNANELPADNTHMDTRMAFSLSYDSKVNDNLQLNYSSHISMEFDYLSLGAGVEFLQDFNQHTTTLLTGINIEYNRVHPVGGIPLPFTSMQPPGTLQPRGEASTTRRQSGVHLGLNQIINKNSLMQIKYAWSNASGYLSDPYKLLSIIDDQNNLQLGSTLDYVYENRPDQRYIQNIYSAYKLYIKGDVLDLSYRYYFQPHLRFYHQTAANFYQHSLNKSIPIPDYASSDFRLAKFNAYTVGFKYGKSYQENSEQSIGIEYYTQIGDSHPDTAIGLQKEQDLFPTLRTLILTWNYSYNW